jgi:hypothetical protein
MNETAGTSQRQCPNCGGAADAAASSCAHCAYTFPATSPVTSSQDIETALRRKNTRGLMVAGAAILALLCAVSLLALYRYKSRASSQVAGSPAVSAVAVMSERATQIEEKIVRGEDLSGGDLTGVSAAELRILRNVHFARYGRKYDRPGLGDYFTTRPWHKPSDSYNDNLLTSTDKSNINLILAAENRAKLSQTDPDPNTNANITVTGPPSTPDAALSSSREFPSCTSGTLTNACAQRALNKWVGSGTVSGLLGVQEIPSQNSAQASFTIWNYHYVGGLDKRTPLTYSGSGTAIFSHFTDGRWVLSRVYLTDTVYQVYINTSVPVD